MHTRLAPTFTSESGDVLMMVLIASHLASSIILSTGSSCFLASLSSRTCTSQKEGHVSMGKTGRSRRWHGLPWSLPTSCYFGKGRRNVCAIEKPGLEKTISRLIPNCVLSAAPQRFLSH